MIKHGIVLCSILIGDCLWKIIPLFLKQKGEAQNE